MQEPSTGEFTHGTVEELQEMLRRSAPLYGEECYPVFAIGDIVYVRNSAGDEAKCKVHNLGKKFMMLKGMPR